MRRSVLDSYALLAFIQEEPAAPIIAQMLEEARHQERELLCSWVNLAEVHYRVTRTFGAERMRTILRMLEQSPILFILVDRQIALYAADIKAQYSIALGDAFAAGTALAYDAEVVTGDPEFARLEERVRVKWLADDTDRSE
jgi:uncharacterized protein